MTVATSMTVSSRVLRAVYPVAGGAGAGLVTRAVLQAARQLVVGGNVTPPGRSGGGTALVWTAVSWAVSGGVGVYAGKKLVRPTPVTSVVATQPAQS